MGDITIITTTTTTTTTTSTTTTITQVSSMCIGIVIIHGGMDRDDRWKRSGQARRKPGLDIGMAMASDGTGPPLPMIDPIAPTITPAAIRHRDKSLFLSLPLYFLLLLHIIIAMIVGSSPPSFRRKVSLLLLLLLLLFFSVFTRDSILSQQKKKKPRFPFLPFFHTSLHSKNE